MNITENKKGDVVLLGLNGRFDASTLGTVEQKIMGIIDSGEKKMGIDLANLDYINSSGLRVILSAAKKLKKADGKFVLFGMKEHIREIFDMTGFSSIITILTTEEDAIKHMN